MELQENIRLYVHFRKQINWLLFFFVFSQAKNFKANTSKYHLPPAELSSHWEVVEEGGEEEEEEAAVEEVAAAEEVCSDWAVPGLKLCFQIEVKRWVFLQSSLNTCFICFSQVSEVVVEDPTSTLREETGPVPTGL